MAKPAIPWLLACGPVLQGLATQLRAVRLHRNWVAEKRQRLGDLGTAHRYLDEVPMGVFNAIMIVIMIVSLIYIIANVVDEFSVDSTLGQVLEFTKQQYIWVFVAWVVLLPIGFWSLFPRTAVFVAGRIPRIRRQVGWANASWHLDRKEAAPAAAIPTGDATRGKVDQILNGLITQEDNLNRALRPDGLSDTEAANLLVFGHVVENVFSSQGIRWTNNAWTNMYMRLGEIAIKPNRPFSSNSILNEAQEGFYATIQTEFNDGLEQDRKLPNNPQIEEDIDETIRLVRSKWNGDSRYIGQRNDLGASSYEVALRQSREIHALTLEEIRRQLAKLLVIWNVWQHTHKPRVFRIPFSAHMAVFLIDRELLLVDGDQFDIEDDRFATVFETAQQNVLAIGLRTIQNATRANWIEWRENEKICAEARRVDWDWFFMYRLDQYIYHLARNHQSSHWRIHEQPRSIRRRES